MKTHLALLCLLVLSLRLPAEVSDVFYSFRTETAGGIARVRVKAESGELVSHEALFSDPKATAIRKVALCGQRRFLFANLDGVEDKDNLLVFDLAAGGSPRFLQVPGAADPVGIFRDRLYAGSDKGSLHRFHPETLREETVWDFRKQLQPSGRRPEDLFLDEEGNILWVSFQKDNRSQRHRGSRIVGIRMDNGKIAADLQLPRDRPELHYSPEVDGREAGPNPEVLYVSSAHNTLFATLDLYGAVGMADLDAARQGRLENWRVLSTAPGGDWGSAFPDRVGLVRFGGHERLLVANASRPGGVAVVDLATRAIVQHLEAPGGLSTLHALPSLDIVVSGSPGKIKSRESGGLGNVSTPLTSWHRFRWKDGRFESLHTEMNTPVHQVAPLSAQHPWVLLNTGEGAKRWKIIHAIDLQEKTEFDAFGAVQRTTR